MSNADHDKAPDLTMEGVQSVLASALRRYGLDKDIARYRFVLKWPDIVGAELAKRTQPEAIRNGTLIVRTCSSSWAQELTFQKEVILHRLRKFLGEGELVRDVTFYVGARSR